ncbi:MAG: hypothetical protein MZW92_46570 [Comamonadaceae bacterium]|nr:hypothetical protein [Comamonadaceae bacterium]
MLLVFHRSPLQLGAYDLMHRQPSCGCTPARCRCSAGLHRASRRCRTTVPDAVRRSRRGCAPIRPRRRARGARAQAFALASSETRSYGVPVIGVEPRIRAAGVHACRDRASRAATCPATHAQEAVLGRAGAESQRQGRRRADPARLGHGRLGGRHHCAGGRHLRERHARTSTGALIELPLGTFQEAVRHGRRRPRDRAAGGPTASNRRSSRPWWRAQRRRAPGSVVHRLGAADPGRASS